MFLEVLALHLKPRALVEYGLTQGLLLGIRGLAVRPANAAQGSSFSSAGWSSA